MEIEATMTTRGRITLPKEVRERFGIESGSTVLLSRVNDGILLRKKKL